MNLQKALEATAKRIRAMDVIEVEERLRRAEDKPFVATLNLLLDANPTYSFSKETRHSSQSLDVLTEETLLEDFSSTTSKEVLIKVRDIETTSIFVESYVEAFNPDDKKYLLCA